MRCLKWVDSMRSPSAAERLPALTTELADRPKRVVGPDSKPKTGRPESRITVGHHLPGPHEPSAMSPNSTVCGLPARSRAWPMEASGDATESGRHPRGA